MELILDTIRRYRQLFSVDPDVVITAPGRVNLIGEHTDYNDGYVLPVAIDRMIVIAAGRRADDALHLHSVDLQAMTILPLSDLAANRNQLWANYPAGVAHIFLTNGHTVGGANFCIRGNIPIAAGLSSSAAFEVASAIAFRQLNRLELPLRHCIKLAQRAEIEFVGLQCGIMDQFVSVMGKKGHAVFLDCLTLTHEYIPLPAGVRIVICDTGLRRELTLSAYNKRKAECMEAVKQLARHTSSIRSLRDITMEQFQTMGRFVTPTLKRRVHHVLSENERVLKSVEAMRRGDLHEFGKHMIDSHLSLRDNYEVSCRELDAFVDIAIEAEGVFGARMTGAGFGGSGVCLVAEQYIDDLVTRLRLEYPKQAGRSLTVYLAVAEDGAMIYNPQDLSTPLFVSQLAS